MATAEASSISGLAAHLSPDAKSLLRRYCANAARHPSRRCVPASNPRLSELISSPQGAELLALAGWTRSEGAFIVADVERLHTVLAAISPSLLALPEDLLRCCLALLDVGCLSAVSRVSKAVRLASMHGSLWRPLCSPRVQATLSVHGRVDSRMAQRLDAICFHAARLEPLWSRLEAHCSPALRHTLRDGCDMGALLAAPPLLLDALPLAVLASLVIRDGQLPSLGEAGLFFGGARLLQLSELLSETERRAIAMSHSNDGGSSRLAAGELLPLSDRVGFMQLACDRDGAIWLVSGFNLVRKAASWPAYLERALWDTV